MSLFYISVGLNHFIDPYWFMQIVPPYLPFHLQLVYISGFFEIAFGIMLLVPAFRFYAGWGLILLLIAVYPANIYLAQTNGVAMNTTPFIAWARFAPEKPWGFIAWTRFRLMGHLGFQGSILKHFGGLQGQIWR